MGLVLIYAFRLAAAIVWPRNGDGRDVETADRAPVQPPITFSVPDVMNRCIPTPEGIRSNIVVVNNEARTTAFEVTVSFWDNQKQTDAVEPLAGC